MSYLYSMSVAAGGETRHAATNNSEQGCACDAQATLVEMCGRAVGREWTLLNKQSVNCL